MSPEIKTGQTASVKYVETTFGPDMLMPAHPQAISKRIKEHIGFDDDGGEKMPHIVIYCFASAKERETFRADVNEKLRVEP